MKHTPFVTLFLYSTTCAWTERNEVSKEIHPPVSKRVDTKDKYSYTRFNGFEKYSVVAMYIDVRECVI